MIDSDVPEESLPVCWSPGLETHEKSEKHKNALAEEILNSKISVMFNAASLVKEVMKLLAESSHVE